MKYLTGRLKQLTDKTVFALSPFHETEADANSQYWDMVAGDIGNSEVTEFTDFVIDVEGNISKKRYYTRIATAEELKKWYHIKIDTFTEESGKSPIKEIREYDDSDSAEIAFCRDNSNAEKNTELLTGAHLVINHHGDVELFELYDNRPIEPEPTPEIDGE